MLYCEQPHPQKHLLSPLNTSYWGECVPFGQLVVHIIIQLIGFCNRENRISENILSTFLEGNHVCTES